MVRASVWVVMGLVAACGERSQPAAGVASAVGPPVTREPAWVTASLPCVVSATLDHATRNATSGAASVVAAALGVWERETQLGARVPRALLRRVVDAFTATVERTDALAHEQAALLAESARALAELGDLAAARARVERALEHADPRAGMPMFSDRVLAWSGAGARALEIAGDRPAALASVAVGFARAGDTAAAARTLARIPAAARTELAAATFTGEALAWSGELAALDALLATVGPEERGTVEHFSLSALRRARPADAKPRLDRAIAEARAVALAAPDDDLMPLVIWGDLVWIRDQLGAPFTARRELHDWIAAAAPNTNRRAHAGINAARAQLVGLAAEAQRMLRAAEGTAPRLEVAIAQGDFAQALSLLPAHREERARATHVEDQPYLDQTIGAVEVDLWLAMAAASPDDALGERFRALVCRPGSRADERP